MNNYMSRKRFITASVLAAVSIPAGLKALSSDHNRADSKFNIGKGDDMKVCIFSKCLHWLNYADMASMVAELGFDGVDLTVRPGGHVLPERVATDLPKAVAAIEKAGLKVYMITTNIKNADEKYTADIVKTASSLGIKYYRTAWYEYNASIDIPANIQVIKDQLMGLEKLNKQYGVHGAYQNHAGKFFGAPIWDLWLALKDTDPQYISCQYDIRHATAEAPDNWDIGLNLLHSHIKTIAIKDIAWQQVANKWQAKSVPVGQGVVDFAKYLHMIKGYGINGPVSMHYEYALGGAEDGAFKITMPVNDFKTAVKTDLNTFRSLLKANYL